MQLISAFFFCYTDSTSTILLLPKSESSSLKPYSVAVQSSLCRTWSESQRTDFVVMWLQCYLSFITVCDGRKRDDCSLPVQQTRVLGLVCQQIQVPGNKTNDLSDRMKRYELRHDKTGLLGFQPGLTQTRLYPHRLETLDLESIKIVLSM